MRLFPQLLHAHIAINRLSHTDVGIVLVLTFGVIIVVFPLTTNTVPSCADVEWTFLQAIRPSNTWADLGSASLSGQLSIYSP